MCRGFYDNEQVIKKADIFGKAYFLIEFLSILSGRLSYLAGELPQFLKEGEGEGGVSRCVQIKNHSSISKNSTTSTLSTSCLFFPMVE